MTRLRDELRSGLANGFGWLFVSVWAAALVAFPLLKNVLLGYAPIVLGIGIGLWSVKSSAIPRIASWIARLPAAQFATGVVAVAFLVRLAAIALFPLDPQADDEQFHAYAVSMLNGEGFGRPGYRAFFPPGMPLALTGWYSLVGASPVAGKLLQAVMSVGVVWQTWRTGRLLLSESSARMAAIVVAGSPTMVFYSATLGYEILLSLLVLLFVRLTNFVSEPGQQDWRATLALGLVTGFATLVKPIGLLFPAIAGLALLLRANTVRRAVGVSLVMAALAAAVVSPWTLRNYRVLGAFVPVSTNGGYTLYSANNPRATGLFVRVSALPGEIDEVSRDRIRFRTALAWIAEHPGQWLRLAAIKNAYVWGTSSSIMAVVSADRLTPLGEQACQALLNVAWAWLFVVCVAATARYRPWGTERFVPVTLVIAYFFAVHCFYEAHSRHHVPVVPLLSLIAASALTRREAISDEAGKVEPS